jgi:hypothetical protein
MREADSTKSKQVEIQVKTNKKTEQSRKQRAQNKDSVKMENSKKRTFQYDQKNKYDKIHSHQSYHKAAS